MKNVRYCEKVNCEHLYYVYGVAPRCAMEDPKFADEMKPCELHQGETLNDTERNTNFKYSYKGRYNYENKIQNKE